MKPTRYLAALTFLLATLNINASPTSGPGPFAGTLGVDVFEPSFDVSVVGSIAGNPITVSISFPLNLVGTLDVAVTKASNGGPFTGVDQLQFTGADLNVVDVVNTLEIVPGVGAEYTFASVTATLSGPPLAVADPDFDGTGTFDLTGTTLTFNSGTLTVVATGLSILIFPPPTLTTDFASTPVSIALAGDGTIVDVPGGLTTLSLDNLSGSVVSPFPLSFTSGGASIQGLNDLTPTYSASGSLTASGAIVPEISTLGLTCLTSAILLAGMRPGRRRTVNG